MRFSEIAAASLLAPLVAAHGGDIPGAPKVFGLPNQLRARSPFAARPAAHVARSQQSPRLQARQGGVDGRCGPDFGGASCDDGVCCSGAGYCGTSKEHCMAPDCLLDFGPGCDANKTPAGASTRNDARPQLGSVSYGGEGVYSCVTEGHVAITYDDGPYTFTDQVLDQFAAKGGKATFFVTGNNIGKGAIDESWSTVIKRMVSDGHQVASHTWSHQDLSAITQEQRYDQMVKNEMAIRNILGKYPTYMRPPYSSCNADCQGVMGDLGYVISYFDLDTDDYNQLTPVKIQTAKDNFKRVLDTGNPTVDSKLAIAHDIHELTALNLTGYMLDYLYAEGYTAVTMGECMGDPESAWYRASGGSAPPPSSTRSSAAPTSTPTGESSKDGSCGGTLGYNCNGFVNPDGSLGECCSQWGWCGNTIDHCGAADCNPLYGKCDTTPTGTASAPTGTPTSWGQVTKDATCGGSKGYTCKGFTTLEGVLSECCSADGWCGSLDYHCGTGCNPAFGVCPGSNASSTASAPTSTASAPTGTPTSSQPSTDGSCGGDNGFTCNGFTHEGVKSECCSQYGWCGASSDHCGTGCNPAFGTCGSSVSASLSSISSTSPSSTAGLSSSAAASVDTSIISSDAVTSTISSNKPDSSAAPPTATSIIYSEPTTASRSLAVSSAGTSNLPIPSSTIATSVRTSSIKPSASPSPTSYPTTPTTPGKCGSQNGGQTCAGFKNSWGWKAECCRKSTGKCSNDVFACGLGCDKRYGKCWW